MDLNARLLALLAQQGGLGGAAAALGGGGGGGAGPQGGADRDAKRRQVEEQIRNSPNELFKVIHRWQLEPGRFENTARVDTVRNLIADPAIRCDLDIVDSEGQSALYYALKTRQHKAARLLLEAGADPFGTDDKSPLRLVFFGTKGDVGSTTLLFARWFLAYLEAQGKKDQALECLSRPPSMLIVVTNKKRPQLNTVELLLKYGVNPSLASNTGWTALHHAAKRGHTGLAKLLIEHGADINAVKNDGFTPLHLAAFNGHCEVVMLLMEAGAMTEALTGENDERPVLGRKTAADLADIDNEPYAAYLIRTWAFWATPSVPKTAQDDVDQLIA